MLPDNSESLQYSYMDFNVDEAVDRAMSIMEGSGHFSGKDNRYIEYSRADFRIHFQYVVEAIQAGSQSLFSDYVDWNMVFFKGLGLEEVLEPTFKIMLQVLEDMGMGDEASHVMSPGLLRLTQDDGHVDVGFKGMPHAEVAESYCRALLRGDRESAWNTIETALEGGVELTEIYDHVFVPSLRNVGVLWQMGRITVAKEHLFTSSTQTIMARLYPKVFAAPSDKGSVLAACVSGELHEMGIRMISDMLELEGFDTSYLGANTPSDSIVEMLTESGATTILLSATMTYHIERLKRLVESIKENPVTRHVKVLVGGRPFLIDPELWIKVGADGYSRDIKEAVQAVLDSGEPR